MKWFHFLACLAVVSANSICAADVVVIRSPVTGTAVQVPDGYFQIIKPGFLIEDGADGLLIQANANSAKTICRSLGRAFVGFQSVMSYNSSPVVSFTAEGLLNIDRAPSESVQVIDVLTCR